ncbi:ABC transporter ATP-binding protein [Hahella aquimaris]|uniref:ABC transporter ATP-binding protein n=1 Tax=Hahella sp. HNIBRBA332 TaxID=3015983 RepID=UPI00273B0E43|nr:ABC transporter ATP-binding protein [Hahella sp. HNIBRBA332]WLQ12551.1 ABC transporter ATP-binding protein [Hahella sp. HNIBRBA332]
MQNVSEPAIAPGRDTTAAADPARALVRLEGLKFRWPGADDDVLDIPELQVREGERIFLRGASGSGKTTLLSLLGGVIQPKEGSIKVMETELSALNASRRDSFRADNIGFIFQMFNLIPYLSLVDNVTLSCRFSKARRQRVSARGVSLTQEAERLLSHLRLDVGKLGRRPVTDLSVGQQQRVAVARALIGSPGLIIADEPTSALDADARVAFIELLFQEVAASGSTLVFVSHDPALQDLFDRTVSLAEINRAYQPPES